MIHRKPLNVLFFGSDLFSSCSLRMLHKLKNEEGLISDITVVSRSPKWCGRRNSILKNPDIRKTASKLDIELLLTYDSTQDVPKFKGKYYDLVIAVSFGKLIPAKLLDEIPYSLNVHPSLLPQYRGSAPIQHTLMNGDKYTGVTIQTLDPGKFDHGKIVAQTEPLIVNDILKRSNSTPPIGYPRKTGIMLHELGIIGADLLAETIRTERFNLEKNDNFITSYQYSPSLASKLNKDTQRINWNCDTAEDILKKFEVLGVPFAAKNTERKGHREQKRVLFHDFRTIEGRRNTNLRPGQFRYDEESGTLIVTCKGNQDIQVSLVQFAGHAIENPKHFVNRLRRRCGISLEDDNIFL